MRSSGVLRLGSNPNIPSKNFLFLLFENLTRLDAGTIMLEWSPLIYLTFGSPFEILLVGQALVQR